MKADPPPPAPFDAFKGLAAKLVRVPKAGADKEAEYQRDRKKKPKRGPNPS